MSPAYEKVAAEQRAEGEPTRRSRVEGMVKERWPTRKHTNTWITHESEEGCTGSRKIALRHVAVRFGKDAASWVEGTGATWLDAMDAVERERSVRREDLRSAPTPRTTKRGIR